VVSPDQARAADEEARAALAEGLALTGVDHEIRRALLGAYGTGLGKLTAASGIGRWSYARMAYAPTVIRSSRASTPAPARPGDGSHRPRRLRELVNRLHADLMSRWERVGPLGLVLSFLGVCALMGATFFVITTVVLIGGQAQVLNLPGTVVMDLVLLAMTVLVSRANRIGVFVSETSVRVRTLFHTWTLPWSEVATIETAPVRALWPETNDRFPAEATASLSPIRPTEAIWITPVAGARIQTPFRRRFDGRLPLAPVLSAARYKDVLRELRTCAFNAHPAPHQAATGYDDRDNR
jgi:hypothetical protein